MKLQKKYESKKQQIKSRLEEFQSLPEKEYIKEHVFCLLTPQSQAKNCWKAVEEIFYMREKPTRENLTKILATKTRFHHTKSLRVLNAIQNWEKTKFLLKEENSFELRNILEKEIKGYGLKEAGHFLRNIGKSNNKIAILDRHILRNLAELKLISEEKIRSKKHYLEIEEKFLYFAEKMKIPADELDLLWWSEENGEIFK